MTFDKDLATQNKQRTQVVEMVQTEDGRMLHVYREKIVKMPKATKKPTATTIKTPRAARAPRVKGQPTKQQRAIELYKENMKLSRDNLIGLFMEKLQMSKSGATTYYYNVIKAV
jgi:hypothetical protein